MGKCSHLAHFPLSELILDDVTVVCMRTGRVSQPWEQIPQLYGLLVSCANSATPDLLSLTEMTRALGYGAATTYIEKIKN
jgi:hypothetical protein